MSCQNAGINLLFGVYFSRCLFYLEQTALKLPTKLYLTWTRISRTLPDIFTRSTFRAVFTTIFRGRISTASLSRLLSCTTGATAGTKLRPSGVTTVNCRRKENRLSYNTITLIFCLRRMFNL